MFWKSSDIFFFPTFYNNECFHLTIIDAIKHHLPVVFTTEGSIRDLVEDGETGFICGHNEVSSLVDALEKLFSQPLKKNGYKRISDF